MARISREDGSRLPGRVRAGSPGRQSRRGVLIREREWRGPDGTKSDAFRTLQRRGRESTTPSRVAARLPRQARVHLPRGAAEGTELQLPPAAGDYPAFRVLFPNQVIRADDLARAMVDAVVSGTGQRGGPVFEKRDIRVIVESLHTHE